MLKDIGYLLRLGWAASPWRSLVIPLVWLYQGAAAFSPLLAAAAVNGLLRNDFHTVTWALLGFTALAGCGFVISSASGAMELKLTDLVAHASNVKIVRGVMSLPSLDDIDEPELQQAVNLAASRQGALGDAYNVALVSIGQLIISTATVVAALLVDWRLLLLIPVSALRLWVVSKYRKFETESQAAAALPEATIRRWLYTLGNRTARLELEQARAEGAVATRIGDNAKRWSYARNQAQLKANALETITSVIYGVAVIGLLVAVGADPARFVAAIMLAGQLSGLIGTVSMVWLELVRGTTQVRHLRTLEQATERALAATAGAASSSTSKAVAAGATGSVQNLDFVHYNYSYPGSESLALTDVNAHIPAGATTAIVGRNGSGKTTLTDVMLGLRGKQAPTFALQDASLVAQFPVRLPLGLDANVYAGAPALRDAADVRMRIDNALETAGIADLVELTQDSDFSGGQWQRIAHARALFAATPVIVLDEPTSALDAFAEQRLLQQLLDLRTAAPIAAQDGQEPVQNTIILVTHRMFMAARCDHIIVIDDGRILEQGSPEQLLAADGAFARLWKLENSDHTGETGENVEAGVHQTNL